jgi:hypothetical protein
VRRPLEAAHAAPEVTREADGCERLPLGLWRAEAGSAAGSYPLPAGLHWKMAAALTATLRGDPIEHGNIRAVESGRQGLRRAVGLSYHVLRMRDHRRKACDRVAFAGRHQPQFSDSVNPGVR